MNQQSSILPAEDEDKDNEIAEALAAQCEEWADSSTSPPEPRDPAEIAAMCLLKVLAAQQTEPIRPAELIIIDLTNGQ